jgi:hypothetical protein
METWLRGTRSQGMTHLASYQVYGSTTRLHRFSTCRPSISLFAVHGEVAMLLLQFHIKPTKQFPIATIGLLCFGLLLHLGHSHTLQAQQQQGAKVKLARVKREAKQVPALVFSIESWEKQLAATGKAVGKNLLKDAKRASIRDFKIKQREDADTMAAPAAAAAGGGGGRGGRAAGRGGRGGGRTSSGGGAARSGGSRGGGSSGGRQSGSAAAGSDAAGEDEVMGEREEVDGTEVDQG